MFELLVRSKFREQHININGSSERHVTERLLRTQLNTMTNTRIFNNKAEKLDYCDNSCNETAQMLSAISYNKNIACCPMPYAYSDVLCKPAAN